MKITRTVVPSVFTTLNIVCGFLSIIFASQGQFFIAAWVIIAAAVFDSLDGAMARMTRSSSQFGVELDSLADVVSFGAAPSFLVYQVYLRMVEPWGILIAALPVVLGAIRLARFNVQLVGFDKDYFNGLPIPMQAIAVCAFILQFGKDNLGLEGIAGAELLTLVVLLSLLMVSHVKYDTMPKFSIHRMKKHPWKYIVILAALLVLLVSEILFDTIYLFQMLMLYVLYGMFRAAVLWIKKIFVKTEHESVKAGKLSSIDI
ncbi:MAG: CDP-diacylglycerol--serine O-phosphatidyltransferase [Ignavibacteriae bacterium]|nr:MAG: CDP-diacylglycerol--serine O-phosphatidyltransferase [Ignavibacteriota bacterium]